MRKQRGGNDGDNRYTILGGQRFRATKGRPYKCYYGHDGYTVSYTVSYTIPGGQRPPLQMLLRG